MATRDTIIAAKEKLVEAFRAKGKTSGELGRLPAGQRLTTGFPVLDLGERPVMDMASWELEIVGDVEKPGKYTLADLLKLGVIHYTQDFHCVTSWSKFDVGWSGISILKIVELVKPLGSWNYLIQYGNDGYSTNVAREDVEREDVFLAFELEGKPIPRDHGYVRLIIPHLYAWKTSKFLYKLEFSAVDKPGFWEVRGYHNRGNAFLEERNG